MSIGGLVSVSGDEVADDRIERALHAFLAGDVDRLRAVISSDPELVNLSWQGNTLLEWATQPPHGIDPAIVQVLIDHGAHLDRALNLAGCWNLPDLCRQLLTGGADPTARADAGITPLESAAMHGSTDAVDILVGYGLHRPGLWLAAAAGHIDVVRSCHLAIQFHKPEMVRVLLARGAATDIVDDNYGADAGGWAAACDDGSPAATTVLALLANRQASGHDG